MLNAFPKTAMKIGSRLLIIVHIPVDIPILFHFMVLFTEIAITNTKHQYLIIFLYDSMISQ